jgi:hypothetical protein
MTTTMMMMMMMMIISFMQGIYTYIPEATSLGNTVTYLLYCTFTLALPEVCVPCPVWLFSVLL